MLTFLTKHIKLLFVQPQFQPCFNQTYILSNQSQLKMLFIKHFFLNHNYKNYHNIKHTLKNQGGHYYSYKTCDRASV
jgi:hypothetical protein